MPSRPINTFVQNTLDKLLLAVPETCMSEVLLKWTYEVFHVNSQPPAPNVFAWRLWSIGKKKSGRGRPEITNGKGVGRRQGIDTATEKRSPNGDAMPVTRFARVG